tara:strand:+ start:60875 stop:61954 length:1080 start_codon:yes stop_codon:yes gene_type:complete
VINRERIINTFCELAKIDSISGEESNISKELIKRLSSIGINSELDSYGNVVSKSKEENTIILSAHMDTVQPGKNIKPVVASDIISSDGSTILGGDCKAGITAILEGLTSIREDKSDPIGVEIIFTKEEEVGLYGAQNLNFKELKSKEAIIFDGEGPVSRITSASPTAIEFDIEITGKAAHAGVEPEKGISAIRIAADLVTRLPQGRLDSESTFNIGRIYGGSVRNTVPETTILNGEFRSLNMETIDSINIILEEKLKEIQTLYPNALIKENIKENFESYQINNNESILLKVQNALSELGLEPDLKPSGGGTDGNVFRKNGITSIVVGMATHNMHTLREYVTISDLVDAAHFCETILKNK